MQKQRGVTLSGFLLWSIVLIIGLLFGFKVGPAYVEFYAIQSQFKAIVADSEVRAGPRIAIEAAFVRRAVMENIRAVGPTDLKITRDGGEVVISAEYSVRVPLFGNLAACMDFNPSSKGN